MSEDNFNEYGYDPTGPEAGAGFRKATNADIQRMHPIPHFDDPRLHDYPEIPEGAERWPASDDMANFATEHLLDAPVRSPTDGNMHLIAYVVPMFITIRQQDAIFHEVYVGYRLQSEYGQTPAFFMKDDLIAYCNLMRRSKPVQACVLPNFGHGVKVSDRMRQTANGISGLYAIVQESSFQLGPIGDVGYTPLIKKVFPVYNEKDYDDVLHYLAVFNAASGDSNHFLRRATIDLWEDDTTNVKDSAQYKYWLNELTPKD